MATNPKSGGDAPAKGCALKISKNSLLECYGPAIGAASYGLLSINVLNPGLNTGIISKRDITNVLLAGSLVGTSCYIYSRPHLLAATNQNRILYAGFGSVVFTFSSILLWAVLRSLLPNNVAVGSVAGLASCYALAKSGKSYLALIDSQIPKK